VSDLDGPGRPLLATCRSAKSGHALLEVSAQVLQLLDPFRLGLVRGHPQCHSCLQFPTSPDQRRRFICRHILARGPALAVVTRAVHDVRSLSLRYVFLSVI
jgi:hypothetical protein